MNPVPRTVVPIGPDVQTSEQPRILGIRGVSNDGIVFIWDRTIALEQGQEGSHIWNVSYQTISAAFNCLIDHESKQ